MIIDIDIEDGEIQEVQASSHSSRRNNEGLNKGLSEYELQRLERFVNSKLERP